MKKSKYFRYDYVGMDEEDVKNPECFLGAVMRLIADLPENMSLVDVEFGIDHQFSRDPYDFDGYYLTWVSER